MKRAQSIEERRADAVQLVGVLCEDWMMSAEEMTAATLRAADRHACGHRESEHVAFQLGGLAGSLTPPAWIAGEELRFAWEAGALEETTARAQLRRKVAEAIAILDADGNPALAAELENAARRALGEAPAPAPALDAEGFPAGWRNAGEPWHHVDDGPRLIRKSFAPISLQTHGPEMAKGQALPLRLILVPPSHPLAPHGPGEPFQVPASVDGGGECSR